MTDAKNDTAASNSPCTYRRRQSPNTCQCNNVQLQNIHTSPLPLSPSPLLLYFRFLCESVPNPRHLSPPLSDTNKHTNVAGPDVDYIYIYLILTTCTYTCTNGLRRPELQLHGSMFLNHPTQYTLGMTSG